MELGFIVDHAHGARLQSRWVPGQPTVNWLGMVKVPVTYPIETHRCTDCGWLDSFAVPDAKT